MRKMTLSYNDIINLSITSYRCPVVSGYSIINSTESLQELILIHLHHKMCENGRNCTQFHPRCLDEFLAFFAPHFSR